MYNMLPQRIRQIATHCHPADWVLPHGRESLWPTLLAALLLTALPALGLAQSTDQHQPISIADYRSGIVTANDGSVLRIDGKTYRLHPGVTVTDEDGSVYDVHDLRSGAQIKFHLQNRKIDQIIWILPR